MESKISEIIEISKKIEELNNTKSYYEEIRHLMDAYRLESGFLHLLKTENGQIIDSKIINDVNIFSGVKGFIRNNMSEKILECQSEIAILKEKLKQYNL